MAELLLHSLAELREIIFGVAEVARPRRIVEIGAESGRFTRELLNWCSTNGATLTTIDPDPTPAVREMAAASRGMHELIVERSLGALEHLGAADLYLVDGDHNFYTVSNELRLIFAAGATPVVLLHDVCWPWARRDLYYKAADLPPEHVHPHTYELGVDLDSETPIDGGFRGLGAFAVAMHEGGSANGVLSAVEEFLARQPGFRFCLVPAVFGLGILYPEHHEHGPELTRLLRFYDRNALLARLEENRLRNYLRVIALQEALESERQRLAAAEQALVRLKRPWYSRLGGLINAALKRSARRG